MLAAAKEHPPPKSWRALTSTLTSCCQDHKSNQHQENQLSDSQLQEPGWRTCPQQHQEDNRGEMYSLRFLKVHITKDLSWTHHITIKGVALHPLQTCLGWQLLCPQYVISTEGDKACRATEVLWDGPSDHNRSLPQSQTIPAASVLLMKSHSIVLPASETLLFDRPTTQEHLNGHICIYLLYKYSIFNYPVNFMHALLNLKQLCGCSLSICFCLFLFSSVSLLIFLLLPPRRSCDRRRLFVCQQNSVMSCGEILMKFWENIVNGSRTIPLNVGDVLDFRGLSKIKANNVLWRAESSLNAFFSSFYLGWSLKSRSSIASDC